ncbi:MAG: phosphate--acyl-ACP acyltransferase [Elusimicrobia bacterium CG06_land_8_20_14_3_00_38_11]|nr:MAG: phosphate--acyl-ACP acyltransferase [Elusimicrobia bacterium CG06_land_8_20_14_3_00_38_11]
MKIVVDAMGGDSAPAVVIEGVIDAAKEYGEEILLVGDERQIKEELKKYKNVQNLPIKIIHSEEVITMNDSPVDAVRLKPNSSIVKGIKLVAEGKAEGFFSAGNSGAINATAHMTLKRIENVSRPAIATVFPTLVDPCVLIDIGANVDSKPKNLLQFAVMGSVYYKNLFKKDRPKIGLLSIGEEPSKGNELTLATYKLISESGLNFFGNIEGRDIPQGKVNVVVCDGFVGNVVIKLSEGISGFLVQLIKNEMKKNPIRIMAAAFILKSVFKHIKKKIDYDEYGGAPLLGVKGVCIIGHGSSNAKAIKNGIRVCIESVKNNIIENIKNEIAKINHLTVL